MNIYFKLRIGVLTDLDQNKTYIYDHGIVFQIALHFLASKKFKKLKFTFHI